MEYKTEVIWSGQYYAEITPKFHHRGRGALIMGLVTPNYIYMCQGKWN